MLTLIKVGAAVFLALMLVGLAAVLGLFDGDPGEDGGP